MFDGQVVQSFEYLGKRLVPIIPLGYVWGIWGIRRLGRVFGKPHQALRLFFLNNPGALLHGRQSASLPPMSALQKRAHDGKRQYSCLKLHL